MKDCKQCGKPVDGDLCPACGYSESGRKPIIGDVEWWRCSDVDLAGNRCPNPGGLSEGTHGQGARWCHLHFPPFRKWNQVDRSQPPRGFKALHSILHRNRVPSDGSLIE